jgi:hypothetical protein
MGVITADISTVENDVTFHFFIRYLFRTYISRSDFLPLLPYTSIVIAPQNFFVDLRTTVFR